VARPAVEAAEVAEFIHPSSVLTGESQDDDLMKWAKRCFEDNEATTRNLASGPPEGYAINLFYRQIHEADGADSMTEVRRCTLTPD